MLKKKEIKKPKPHAPEWATQPFGEFLERTHRLGQLLHLSMSGISNLRGIPTLVELLAEVAEEYKERSHDRLKAAKKEAELAEKEVAEGFPILHAQTTISLWSNLEAAIRLFIVRWIQNDKKALKTETIQRLRVTISDYESLEGEDRYFYILDRLEQELSAPLKMGITRFESILEPFDLSGPVDENMRRDLFEFNQIRNVLVHRSGLADRRLINSCPWMNYKVGDAVKVSHEMIERYFEATYYYITELMVRVGMYFGLDVIKYREKIAVNK